MPLYRYECSRCKKEFTTLCGMGKEDTVNCNECGSSQVEKLLPRFFTARTSEGNITGKGCSTCAASSCAGCHN